tara:strand:- start:1246 stop:1428 length:183 start_codon:yes stop_codon:yes gene_type:complete
MTETNALHIEEQVALEIQRKQVECVHNYRLQGEIGKYYSYACKKCHKVYWVERNINPNKT